MRTEFDIYVFIRNGVNVVRDTVLHINLKCVVYQNKVADKLLNLQTPIKICFDIMPLEGIMVQNQE